MIREIHLSSAFSFGSNIWVVPHTHHTSMVKELDYFTQFQLSKNKQKSTFMLFNHPLLPCSAIIQTHYDNSQKETWITEVFNIWEKQKKESLRIFMPDDFNIDLCKEFLQSKFPSNADISLVSED